MPIPRAHADEAERLAGLIREQAADESAQTLATARAQAERIEAAGRAEAEAVRTAAESEGEARGRRRAAELLAVARAQRRMSLLQVRESLIEAALAQAHARLASPTTLPGACETLAALLREALPLFPAGPVRVRVGDGDAALLNSAVCDALGARRWTLHVEPSAVPGGGVIVESEDGRLCFDNSLEARSRRRRDHLRQVAASILLLDTQDGGGQR